MPPLSTPNSPFHRLIQNRSKAGFGLCLSCHDKNDLLILYDNPHLLNCGIEEFTKTLRQNGVVLIQAHPFREAFYIPNPGHLPIEYIDGVEVYNKGNSTEEMNQKALNFANENPQLIRTSSADAHTTDRVMLGGIITDTRIKCSQDLAKVLRQGSYQLIVPEE